MKNVSVKKYAIALYESIKGAEKKDIPRLVESFTMLLKRNKDVSKADKIIKYFSQYFNEQEGRIEVTVTTAQDIQEQLEHIRKVLQDSFKKEIDIKPEVDPNIIGGVIFKYGDNIADGSIKRRIELMAEELK